MKARFSLYLPTRILFGPGRLKDLSTTRYLPGRRALVVVGAGGAMKRHGYLSRVLEGLERNGASSMVFDKILPNPVSEHVEEGAALARAHGCDFVVGLGGGSSIDSAKSIALMARNPGSYWDYVTGGSGKGKRVTEGALPIVAIPTTAGTGTEADPWTVITKTQTREKIGFGIDATFPTLSIVDPELMTSVPAELTAFQGMDAFFHAVEGYLATASQPASDVYALSAIEIIASELPVAVRDGSNLGARTALAWASTQAGMVESLSCCISHHSLEHALSAFYPELPHGAGLILLSIPYFGLMAQRSPERFPAMARAMGEDVDSLPTSERPMAFISGLRRLLRAIGMEELSLARFGIAGTDPAALARNARETMGDLFRLDPCELSREDVEEIFRACP